MGVFLYFRGLGVDVSGASFHEPDVRRLAVELEPQGVIAREFQKLQCHRK